MILPQSLYAQETVTVAKKLLGCYLAHLQGEATTVGRIVETEAYLVGDPASHAFIGKTPRNRVMFGPVGHAYVYLIYGMHHCVNAVTGQAGTGEAVLIRALELIQGIAVMQERRRTHQLAHVCNGPGRLTEALAIRRVFNGAPLFFVPYALANYDDSTARVQEALAPLGIILKGVHEYPSPRQAIEEAGVLYVGGGNSFRLLKALQQQDLLDLVRRGVMAGELHYLGASAGSNMACPSLRTTNDMPIVQPRSFEALGLLPFQINPHYLDPDPTSTHMGETRAKRIEEFLEENDVPVLGMREGSWLRCVDSELRLEGLASARLFTRNAAPQEIEPGSDLSWLLKVPAHFDRPASPGHNR